MRVFIVVLEVDVADRVRSFGVRIVRLVDWVDFLVDVTSIAVRVRCDSVVGLEIFIVVLFSCCIAIGVQIHLMCWYSILLAQRNI